MDRFNIRNSIRNSAAARRSGIRGLVWSAWRALGLADDETAQAGRALLFSFA